MRKGLFALLLAGWATIAAAQLDPNRVLVTVNGEEIRASEYYTRMEILPGVGRFLDDGKTLEESPPGVLTLQLLIEERTILLCAKENGVTPSQAEIDALYNEKYASKPEAIKNFAALGVSPEAIKNQLMVELAQFKLMTKGITVTDQEIERHYKQYPTEFTTPRTMKLSIIAVDADSKATVDQALAAGKPFAEVARAYSTDPTAKAGGLLGEVDIAEFNEAVGKLIENTKIGSTTDWVEGSGRFVKFWKQSVTPAKLQPLDDELKKRIRRTLMLDRGAVKNDLDAMLRATRKKMVIEIKTAPFKTDLQKLINRYKLGG